MAASASESAPAPAPAPAAQLCRQQRPCVDEYDCAAQLQVWHLMLGFISSVALKAACMLQIPDLLAREGPLTLQEIASRLSSKAPNTDHLYRLLRFLCMRGVFSVEQRQNSAGLRPDSKYCITPVSKFLVRGENESSLGALALFVTSMEIQASAFHLPECVLEAGGVGFDKAHGMDMWSFANSNQSFNGLFNKAMAGCSHILMKSILAHYHGFDNIDTLVDVGGGIGASISLIKTQHPSIKAINFDLPHVVATAPPIPGVEHVGGDMFESLPSAGAIFLKWILHNWDDESCSKILKNCRKAIPKTGKVIIVDMVLEMNGERASAKEDLKIQLDVMMMTLFDGKERTREQWEALLAAAGFSRCSVMHLPNDEHSVIEAFPDA